jgi:hypothetical protein
MILGGYFLNYFIEFSRYEITVWGIMHSVGKNQSCNPTPLMPGLMLLLRYICEQEVNRIPLKMKSCSFSYTELILKISNLIYVSQPDPC